MSDPAREVAAAMPGAHLALARTHLPPHSPLRAAAEHEHRRRQRPEGGRTLAYGVGIMPPVVTRTTVPPGQLRRGECVLYRTLSASGEPIYIGITQEPYNRWQAHLSGKPWADEIAAIYYQCGLTEGRARELEREAIRVERPRYDRTRRKQ